MNRCWMLLCAGCVLGLLVGCGDGDPAAQAPSEADPKAGTVTQGGDVEPGTTPDADATNDATDRTDRADAQAALASIRFMRFDEHGSGLAILRTATVRYTNPQGVVVDLISVVHIADRDYYEHQNESFRQYDALLYEMVKPKDEPPPRPGEATSGLSAVQLGMTRALGLAFQLDVIDYHADNFIHADMDPTGFLEAQRERGESFTTMIVRAYANALRQQQSGQLQAMDNLELLRALSSRDQARAMKYLMAKQMDQMEHQIATLFGDGETVILTDRNKAAIEVLKDVIQQGKRHIGLFYGAAHMPDLEERLFALGFSRTSKKWHPAWVIAPAN